ncbi:MAG: HD domain-containing protein [Chloroflexi bacterium]|nr:HD domain-containing protein [Chloroflexota bacterium]
MTSEQPNFVADERFADALQYAYELHRRQGRKGSGIPYLGHLLGVCSLVLEAAGDEDQAIAGLLHDGPEDQGGLETLDEIRRRFGDRVADIVEACSDTFETPKPPWRERKEAYIERLREEPPDVLLVSLADKVFNAGAILNDLRTLGDDLWSRFKGGKDGTLWSYRELADVFAARLPGTLADELTATVDDMTVLAGVEGGGDS